MAVGIYHGLSPDLLKQVFKFLVSALPQSKVRPLNKRRVVACRLGLEADVTYQKVTRLRSADFSSQIILMFRNQKRHLRRRRSASSFRNLSNYRVSASLSSNVDIDAFRGKSEAETAPLPTTLGSEREHFDSIE